MTQDIVPRADSHNIDATDLYELLGVNRKATPTEIRKAYRRLALVYHPDVYEGSDDVFSRMATAYSILIDQEKRKQYDLTGSFDADRNTELWNRAMSIIVESFDSMLDNPELDLGTSDFISILLRLYSKAQNHYMIEKTKLTRGVASLNKAIKNMKVREGRTPKNFMFSLLEAKKAPLVEELEHITFELDALQLVVEEITSYTSAVEVYHSFDGFGRVVTGNATSTPVDWGDVVRKLQAADAKGAKG